MVETYCSKKINIS